ncbi:hypothetical protein NN561_012025 [Cricetulus griseus]
MSSSLKIWLKGMLPSSFKIQITDQRQSLEAASEGGRSFRPGACLLYTSPDGKSMSSSLKIWLKGMLPSSFKIQITDQRQSLEAASEGGRSFRPGACLLYTSPDGKSMSSSLKIWLKGMLPSSFKIQITDQRQSLEAASEGGRSFRPGACLLYTSPDGKSMSSSLKIWLKGMLPSSFKIQITDQRQSLEAASEGGRSFRPGACLLYTSPDGKSMSSSLKIWLKGMLPSSFKIQITDQRQSLEAASEGGRSFRPGACLLYTSPDGKSMSSSLKIWLKGMLPSSFKIQITDQRQSLEAASEGGRSFRPGACLLYTSPDGKSMSSSLKIWLKGMLPSSFKIQITDQRQSLEAASEGGRSFRPGACLLYTSPDGKSMSSSLKIWLKGMLPSSFKIQITDQRQSLEAASEGGRSFRPGACLLYTSPDGKSMSSSLKIWLKGMLPSSFKIQITDQRQSLEAASEGAMLPGLFSIILTRRTNRPTLESKPFSGVRVPTARHDNGEVLD